MSERRHPPSAIPILVVLLGFAAAIFTWSRTAQAERQAGQQRLGQRAWHAAQRVADAVQRETQALWLLQLATRAVPGPAQRAADETLDKVLAEDRAGRALAWVAWALPLQLAQADTFERDRQRTGGRALAFHVHSADGSPVGARDGDDAPGDAPLWVVDRVSPQDRGDDLLGLDLASDPVWRDTIDGAVTNARLGISFPPRPLAAAGGGLGVFVAMPVYESIAPPADAAGRAADARSVIVGELALQPVLEAALAPSADPRETVVSATVLDHGVVLGRVGPDCPDDATKAESSVRVGGRVWTLELRSAFEPRRTPVEWLDRTSIVLPPAVLLLMCLLSWIVWSQQRQTGVIHDQVARQTAVLRQQNVKLGAKERELEEVNQRLREMSNTDPLTGILNRRAFELQIDKERERSRRTGVPFGLLVFDVDHFKAFNDRYGHAAGDAALRQVAQLIGAEARRIDCVARYGGEEFVLLAAGADVAGLAALAERVRAHVESAAIANEAAPRGVITLSGGGALSTVAEDPRALFDAADRCLYQAKATGRNRVLVLT